MLKGKCNFLELEEKVSNKTGEKYFILRVMLGTTVVDCFVSNAESFMKYKKFDEIELTFNVNKVGYNYSLVPVL